MALPDLSGMSQDQAIAALRQYYANIGQVSPQDARAGTGFAPDPEYGNPMGVFGNDMISGLVSAPGGGYSGNLTPSFDSLAPGGQYGAYSGYFDAGGALDPNSVRFTRDERDQGWLSNNIAALTALAAGGSAAFGMGAFGGGAAGAAGEGVAGGFSGAASGSGAAGSGIADALAASSAGTGIPGAAGSSSILGGAGGGGFGSLTGSTLLAGGGLAPALTSEAIISGGIGSTAAAGGGLTLAGVAEALGGARGLAGAAGALAGAAGSRTQTASSETSIPEWLRPYAGDLVQRGQDYASQGPQQYTDPRFVGPNDAQRTAWEMVNQASQNPTAQQGQAATAYGNLVSGQMPTFANGERANNQYIGQTTPGASNQYIGQTTGSNVLGLTQGVYNPELGKSTQQIGTLGQMSLAQSTTGVGRNALLGQNNPHLNDAIGYATGDITRNYENTINPQLDRMARASGSFGNSGVEQARQEAQRTMANQVGRTTSDMRMADYALQAQLGEGDLNRRTSASLADTQRNLGASTTEQQFNIGNDFRRRELNSNYQAGDLARNLTGYDTQAGRTLQAGMFDTTMRNNDLTRNTAAQQSLGQFNANLTNSDLLRNTTATGQQQQFNAGQGNFDITNGLNAWNSTQNRAASTLPQWQSFAEQPYRAANALGTVGQQINAYEQRPLDFNYNEFTRMQADEANRLGTYGSLYGQARGGNSVQSQQNGGNTAAGIMGGVASGVGLYNLLTGTRY